MMKLMTAQKQSGYIENSLFVNTLYLLQVTNCSPPIGLWHNLWQNTNRSGYIENSLFVNTLYLLQVTNCSPPIGLWQNLWQNTNRSGHTSHLLTRRSETDETMCKCDKVISPNISHSTLEYEQFQNCNRRNVWVVLRLRRMGKPQAAPCYSELPRASLTRLQSVPSSFEQLICLLAKWTLVFCKIISTNLWKI
jgi:hypothetical protein